MFKNIFKIIKYDVNTQIVIFNKIKITFKNNAMKKILKDIEKENNFEDYKKRNVDITQVPQAKGVLREKQLKCLEILKKVANICDKNNINYWLAFGAAEVLLERENGLPVALKAEPCKAREAGHAGIGYVAEGLSRVDIGKVHLDRWDRDSL